MVVFRCHLLRSAVHRWQQQQSSGVITAPPARARAQCHYLGPAIRYSHLRCMATINKHLLLRLRSSCSPSRSSGLFISCTPPSSVALPVPNSLCSFSQMKQSCRPKQVKAFIWKSKIVTVCTPGDFRF